MARLGAVTPRKMRAFRKYAVLVLLILAAVITPSTDPVNMAVVFVPLNLLYEVGILVSTLFARTPLVTRAGNLAHPGREPEAGGGVAWNMGNRPGGTNAS